MPSKKKSVSKNSIESIKHKDKRANIPTEELREFVAEDESKPKIILYPRDQSLDPQLVWKGKDEQDQKDLAVPAVPVYIQEKIHPKVLIEDMRRISKKEASPQAELFADFNGLNFESMVDFYHHESNWSNRMILGDSLLVMTSLAEKEGLKGKVQMIYIDPPYGIKFGSNWQVSTRKRDVKDGKVEDATRQPEQIRAFRDTWQLGIHSYLAYLRGRLILARELLTETGSIFVQIGDENVHLIRCILDEVFGSENHIANITYRVFGVRAGLFLDSISDNIIWYSKEREITKYHQLYMPPNNQSVEEYEPVRLFRPGSSASLGLKYSFQKKEYSPPSNMHWATGILGLDRLKYTGRLISFKADVRYKRYMSDFPFMILTTTWNDTWGEQDKWYVVQTATKVIERCLLMTTDPGDLVLDPTCGSGTTAFVAEQWGRRWITIDTSRVALALARTRLMSAKYPYYILSDSTEGLAKEAEITGKTPPSIKTENDIKKGFVYKRVPHITLKSIANNNEINEIHNRWQEKLEPVRKELNALLKQKWEEWEVPREPETNWSQKTQQLLTKWWDLRRERQKEIDDSITKNADLELLYDQPYEDHKRIRVTGPFTVESLSPHRILSTDEERPESEREVQKDPSAGQFETMILDNLKKAGVQNTVKNERLLFNRLETFAGTWLQAEGEYTEKDGTSKRVAISIGPEHGTVGTEQVKEAAKEALHGIGFDLLIICGFAFDAHANETAKEFTPETIKKSNGFAVTEETRQYGRLPILLARMNPDLAMGDELLKNTGAGNLFMVFGEPDIDIKKTKDGKLVLKIKGVDVYDPTTGQIRNSSTDDIACWFIDTDYNGESFFVRHAYFTGADQPYDKLKRALRAEIDESAWSALYSTESRPFDSPKTRKIAVKVINHYGDEVLKVYEV